MSHSVPQQVPVSVLRKELFTLLKRLPSDGPIEIMQHGRVVAMIIRPQAKRRAVKPVIDRRRIARFCKKYEIKRFALFGSIVRDDFGPNSDVDVLVDAKRRGGPIDTLEGSVDAHEELVAMFGRPVDLLNRRVLLEGRNELRKQSILEDAKVIYEAC